MTAFDDAYGAALADPPREGGERLVGGFCWRCLTLAEDDEEIAECDRLGMCRREYDRREAAKRDEAAADTARRQTDLFHAKGGM